MEKTCVKKSKISSNTSVNFAKLNFPCQNHIMWASVRFLLSDVSICLVSNCPHTDNLSSYNDYSTSVGYTYGRIVTFEICIRLPTSRKNMSCR